MAQSKTPIPSRPMGFVSWWEKHQFLVASGHERSALITSPTHLTGLEGLISKVSRLGFYNLNKQIKCLFFWHRFCFRFCKHNSSFIFYLYNLLILFQNMIKILPSCSYKLIYHSNFISLFLLKFSSHGWFNGSLKQTLSKAIFFPLFLKKTNIFFPEDIWFYLVPFILAVSISAKHSGRSWNSN